ncbi:MAG TPA: hypothetical protein VD835_09815 [Pyrinomonadaceae bacterium]|nr:hypothetical protein [Pyrinomonadaceae bacterium]
MLSLTKRTLIAFMLAVAIAPVTYSQAASGEAKRTSDDENVSERGFKNRVFEIKHADPFSLLQALRPLGSGFKGALMVVSQELKTLTMRDFPENIATVEESLKRLDVAQAPSPNIELHMHVLIGSNTDVPAQQLPSEVRDVVTQLRSTLNYKNYSLLTSLIERTKANTRAFLGNGVAEIGAPLAASGRINVPFEYKIEGVSLSTSANAAPVVHLREISFTTQTTPQLTYVTRLSTSVSLRDGERVVVGTASLRDTSLILVLSARLLP